MGNEQTADLGYIYPSNYELNELLKVSLPIWSKHRLGEGASVQVVPFNENFKDQVGLYMEIDVGSENVQPKDRSHEVCEAVFRMSLLLVSDRLLGFTANKSGSLKVGVCPRLPFSQCVFVEQKNKAIVVHFNVAYGFIEKSQ